MKKNVGLTYGEFEFPAEQGFTGSRVKGYKRGGAVKKMAGGFMGPEREIQVDDVTITTPRAKGGAVHNKLVKHGAKMGFAYGGRVKDTSGEFKAKRGKQKTMDSGVQPARRGKNARNAAQAEAGGTGRLLPGLKKGGSIKGKKDSGGGALADAALRRAREVLKPKKHKMKKPEKAIDRAMRKGLSKLKGTMSDGDRKAMKGIAGGLKASKEGMPKNVKMAGGMVHKARGGSVKK
jgi:hypothetical protein